MISFDDFLKQDDEEKYNNMQRDNFEIQTLKNDLKNRDNYISKLEVAYSKNLERLKLENEKSNNIINKLEERIKYEISKSGFEQDYQSKLCYENILDELEELKGSVKE